MATITTINENDYPVDSRAVINTNFDNLNTDKIETSVIDTDTTLAADSDSKIATQKATKAYVDAKAVQTTSISTSSTPSIDTVADQTLTIIAKGIYSTTGSTDANVTVNMKNNGNTIDTCVVKAEASTAGGTANTVTFIYFGTPGEQTNNITFDQTLTNVQVLFTLI